MKWLGTINGESLRLAVTNDFKIFITADKNLKYQQNLTGLDLITVLLDLIDNDFSNYNPLIPSINIFLQKVKSDSFLEKYIEIK